MTKKDKPFKEYEIRVYHGPYAAVFYEPVEDHLKRLPDVPPEHIQELVDEIRECGEEGVEIQMVRASYDMPPADRKVILKHEMISEDTDGRVVKIQVQRLAGAFASQTKVPREEWHWEVNPR